MGLDEHISGISAKEHALAGHWGTKINAERAWAIASATNHKPRSHYHSEILGPMRFGFGGLRQDAANKVKELVRVTQYAYRVHDPCKLDAYQSRIQKGELFSQDNQELCLLALDLFRKRPDFKLIPESFSYEPFKTLFAQPKNGITATDAQAEAARIRHAEREFQHKPYTNNILSDEHTFLARLMNWLAYYVRETPALAPQFTRATSLLNMLAKEMSYGYEYEARQLEILPQPIGNHKIIEFYNGPRNPQYLEAKLNNSLPLLMSNDADCCITGPHGQHRETAPLYWLDPSVHVLELYARCEQEERARPFGLGLFIKARGRHHGAQKDSDYLIFEGFPANGNEYVHAAELIGIQREGEPRMRADFMSLAEFIYAVGLETARRLNCDKMLINTSHSGHTQFSVRDTVQKLVEYTKNEADWDAQLHRLTRDPLAPDGSFGQFVVPAGMKNGHIVKQQTFAYTHFLKKAPFPQHTRKQLQRAKQGTWQGEIFSDTFHEWTRFAGNTYRRWHAEDRKLHPYARGIADRADAAYAAERHPESFWNLGIGYCTGIEVDVEKECARLSIK